MRAGNLIPKSPPAAVLEKMASHLTTSRQHWRAGPQDVNKGELVLPPGAATAKNAFSTLNGQSRRAGASGMDAGELVDIPTQLSPRPRPKTLS